MIALIFGPMTEWFMALRQRAVIASASDIINLPLLLHRHPQCVFWGRGSHSRTTPAPDDGPSHVDNSDVALLPLHDHEGGGIGSPGDWRSGPMPVCHRGKKEDEPRWTPTSFSP